jgi:hypothetical protein
MGKKGKKLHFLGQMQQKIQQSECTRFIAFLNLHNKNTLIWILFIFWDALPLLAKFQLSKFMKIHKISKSLFVFLKQCGHYSSNIFSFFLF